VATAIITGADSGIGRATAVILAERGWDVGITFHEDDEGARETAQEVESHGRRCEVRELDLNEAEKVQPLVDEMIAALGGCDLFVNNAGMGIEAPFVEMELADWRTVLDVNLTGAFLAGQAAARWMVANGVQGAIVNVSSVHEHVPLRNSAAYCASKGGMGLLTKVMALELASHGIRVNSVAPGEIATPMTGQDDGDPREVDRPAIPWGRPGHAREIGEWIAFVGSDAARYATGQSYVVDGGLLLMAAIANQDGFTP
jgi:NAD(P)-dependent dehydrogenase (short-subunit alcohol dehydrogenase family)